MPLDAELRALERAAEEECPAVVRYLIARLRSAEITARLTHDLVGKTISRDDEYRHDIVRWPWGSDSTEATIIAVWVDGAEPEPCLRFTARDANGLIRDVWAGNVKLGPFVEIPRSEIRCPECGHSMGTIAATKTCQGLHDYCPDVSELRRLLGRAMGVASATQERLAELVGCSHDAIREWEHGKHRPSRAFRSKLVELEGKLKDGGLSLDAALTGRVEAEQPARPTPTFVNVVSAKLDGDLALLHFGAKLPGDKEPRTVADVLVSRAALEKALGTSLPGARMPGSNSVGGEG